MLGCIGSFELVFQGSQSIIPAMELLGRRYIFLITAQIMHDLMSTCRRQKKRLESRQDTYTYFFYTYFYYVFAVLRLERMNTCLNGFLSLITVFFHLCVFCIFHHRNFFSMEFLQWLLHSPMRLPNLIILLKDTISPIKCDI